MMYRYLLRGVATVLLVIASVGAIASEIRLRPFDGQSMNAIRQSHAGRPFVLAFWSIACEPCRGEMSTLRNLEKRYPGVPVVLVSTDGAPDKPAVLRFLSRYAPRTAENWLFADEFVERLRYSVDPAWRGELPRTYFFDASHAPLMRSGTIEPQWAGQWFMKQAMVSPKR